MKNLLLVAICSLFIFSCSITWDKDGPEKYVCNVSYTVGDVHKDTVFSLYQYSYNDCQIVVSTKSINDVVVYKLQIKDFVEDLERNRKVHATLFQSTEKITLNRYTITKADDTNEKNNDELNAFNDYYIATEKLLDSLYVYENDSIFETEVGLNYIKCKNLVDSLVNEQ